MHQPRNIAVGEQTIEVLMHPADLPANSGGHLVAFVYLMDDRVIDVPEEVRFDAIWSNPPIRVGKEALHELLLQWLPRLTDDGEARLVVGKNLGADSLQRWLTGQGWPTERVASGQGFRVLVTRRP